MSTSDAHSVGSFLPIFFKVYEKQFFKIVYSKTCSFLTVCLILSQIENIGQNKPKTISNIDIRLFREMFGINVTPLPFIPGARIEHHLGDF